MSKKNKNRNMVNIEDLIVSGDPVEAVVKEPKEEIKEEAQQAVEEPEMIAEVIQPEEKKEETVVIPPVETVEESVVEPEPEPVLTVEAVPAPEVVKTVQVEEAPKKEEPAKEPAKRKVVAVPCVTKNVKAIDFVAEQHGYAVNINLPQH